MDPLLHSLPERDRQSLLACAVPNWFDQDILAELLQDAAQACAFLDTVQPFAFIHRQEDPDERYALEPGAREELLAILQNQHMQLYIAYQIRAFQYFSAQLSSAGTNWLMAEQALMEHLSELFYILIDNHQLPELAHLLAQAAAASLGQVEHRYLLRYFQACLANEQGQYRQVERTLLQLCVEPALDKRLHARILTALGHSYDYRGQFDRALAAHQESAALYRELGDISGESKALRNEGIVYHEIAHYEQALALFKHSYLLAQQANDLRLQGYVLLELGYTDKELGHWDKAFAWYQQSIEIWQQLGLRDSEAKVYNNLGEVALLLGHWDKAEVSYQQALALTLSERETADMLYNLGFLYAVQDQVVQARQLYTKALKLAQKVENFVAVSQIYYRLGDLWRRQGDLHQAYQAYQQAITAIELMRGQVGQEEIRISVFGIRQHVYEAMVLLCLELGKPAEALNYVEQAKARAFLDRLAQARLQSARQAELPDETPLTAAQIQAQLPPQTVLVEYFATGAAGPAAAMLNKLPPENQRLHTYLLPPERLLAFVVTTDALTTFDLNVSLHRLAAEHFYRGDMRLRGTKPTPGQPLPVLHRWRNLDRQLLEPLRAQLTDKQHLFLVPHGVLHYLPLHALAPNAQLGHDSTPTVSYAPSASVLLKTVLTKQAQKATTRCLAIGVDKAGLQHAEAEAKWIAAQWSGQALLGKDATFERVVAALDSARIVHFACHGHFRRTTPMNSALVLADGELTAADILQMVQFDADLVTLSACDTGLNYLAYGDELLGIVRACFCAGARALLVALWQVHDIPTRLFMERFYQVWQTGTTRSAALVEAQQYLRTLDREQVRIRLTDYQLAPAQIEALMTMFTTMLPGSNPFDHPYYWGAFLLIGDPF